MDERNTIKFAFHLKNWDFISGSKGYLRTTAKTIPPLEYRHEMKGEIFCPECCAPVFRSPEDKDYATDGRRAFYAHSRGVDSECSLRVKKGEGKRYTNEEEAKQAIQDEELVIVSSFMTARPEPPIVDGPLFYDREPNEDRNGPLTDVAVGRHNGESFNLPSKVTSVRSLCRSFDANLNRYFLLPGQRHVRTLRDQIFRINEVDNTCEIPRLYAGKIIHSESKGPNPWNIRMTYLQFPNGHGGFKDFCLKAEEESSKEHGIDDHSKGRIVLAYGKVSKSGIGLCIKDLGWGEFSLLPAKYEHLMDMD